MRTLRIKSQWQLMNIKVYSHFRSGSHLFSYMLAKYVLGFDNYVNTIYGGHRMPERFSILPEKYFYCRRNITDSVISMYKMRHRLGLESDAWELFAHTTIGEMRNFNHDFKIEVNTGDKVERKDGQVDMFIHQFAQYTPSQYIKLHQEAWQKTDAHIIDYDNLIAQPNDVMSAAANYLNLKLRGTAKIPTDKIGWTPL